jgi:hypothetical protein
MSDPDDDDFLDGMCDLDFDNGPEVSDEDAPYVVLFARHLTPDLRVRNWADLERAAHEWHVLFDAPVS